MASRTVVLACSCLLAAALAFHSAPRAPTSLVFAAQPLLRTAKLPAPGWKPIARVAAVVAAASEPESEAEGEIEASLTTSQAAAERKKIVPLGLMFFFILFSYTILRDTKDVLVVTAPKSGAEIIPFLKTYVNLPGAIGFTVLYSKLTNKYSREEIFYRIVGTFVAFFGLFALLIYPCQGFLHPTTACDALAAMLPAGFQAPIAIVRNWTYALFYTMAELWGSVVISVLFWGFANEVTTVNEAKKYYPLFGLGANVALIFSGQYVRYVSGLRRTWASAGAAAGAAAVADPWGASLRYLMGAVVASGVVVMGIFRYFQTNVLTDPACMDQVAVKKAQTKTTMGLGDSFKFLASSKYIRNLATLVIAYGMSINIVEVTWKSKLKAQFPNPNDYSEFMGAFSTATGAVTLGMMLLGRQIFKVFGWGVAALVTPTMLALTGGIFFGLILFEGPLTPLIAVLGTTPLMLAVLVGAAQNILSKSAKYSLFDPGKEMAYIPLDAESKTKGKAAIDVIGNPLGKSGGSFIQQGMIFVFGSLALSTPYLAAILGVIILVWIRASRTLAVQFKEAGGET